MLRVVISRPKLRDRSKRQGWPLKLIRGWVGLLAVLLTTGCTTAGNAAGFGSPSSSKTVASSSCVSQPPEIDQLVQQFVVDWNQHRGALLVQLFTANAELDMSAPNQGTQYQQTDQEWTALIGPVELQRFAEQEWAVGEHLAFSGVKKFSGGGYALGMEATFSDGRRQVLNDAKFTFDPCQALLTHVVIVAMSPAGS